MTIIATENEVVRLNEVGAQGPAGPQGPTGPPGAVWRSGTGVPANSLGVNGDFFLSTDTGNVYEKVAGAYVLRMTLATGTAVYLAGSGLSESPANTFNVNVDGQTIQIVTDSLVVIGYTVPTNDRLTKYDEGGRLQANAPVDGLDVVNKTYVDALILPLPPSAYKNPPARVATTTNVNLAVGGLLSPDSIVAPLTDGQTVAVINQTNQTENGLYLAHVGAWTRRSDFDAPGDLIPGAIVPVSEGTTYGNHLLFCSTDDPVVIGTTPITFTDLGNVAGGVTSVSLTAPTNEFDVGGSPVTSIGTLALTWKNQTANRVLAGPTTGSPAQPSFRPLVIADVPAASVPTTNTLVKYDGSSQFTVLAPTTGNHPTTKTYVDNIYDIGVGCDSLPRTNGFILNFKAPRTMSLAADFAGFQIGAVTPATALTTFTVLKNGVSIGTMSFAASASVPTFTVVGTTSLVVGDTLRILNPAVADATLADIGGALLAVLG